MFTCAFNYMDDLVLTGIVVCFFFGYLHSVIISLLIGSKDNTCAIWKQGDAEPSQDSNDI